MTLIIDSKLVTIFLKVTHILLKGTRVFFKKMGHDPLHKQVSETKEIN